MLDIQEMLALMEIKVFLENSDLKEKEVKLVILDLRDCLVLLAKMAPMDAMDSTDKTEKMFISTNTQKDSIEETEESTHSSKIPNKLKNI